MTLLLFMLVFLISLLIVVSVFADHLIAFAQQHLPTHGEEGEQLILLSGMLLERVMHLTKESERRF